MKIGITGGIGSGKSFVCKLLSERGINVYDCDRAAKRLMRSSSSIQRQLTSLIGENAYIDGQLNKAAVATFLLASEENAHAIDAIVHPAVADDFINSGMEWMECAIMYESGFDRLVDKVIVVTAPEDVRIERIMKRDGITADKARQWIAKQWKQDEVIKRADYEIINDGQHNISQQIDTLLNKL